MGLESVVPDQYEARAVDWGLTEIESLDNAIQAYVKFTFKDQAGADQEITWKSFLKKRDGGMNKKTISTIKVLAPGVVDDDGQVDFVGFMDPGSVDTAKKVSITIVDQPNKDGSRVYKNVEWVNELGEGGGSDFFKMTPEKKKSLSERLIEEGLGKKAKGKKAAPKNYAPGASNDDGGELPF